MLTRSRREQLHQQNEYRLYNKIMLKYRIMAVRAKLAFEAMMKKMTVVELIGNQCLKTHDLLVDLGICQPDPLQAEVERVLAAAMAKGNISVLKALVATAQRHELRNLEVEDQASPGLAHAREKSAQILKSLQGGSKSL